MADQYDLRATAEIEAKDDEVVIVETPTIDKNETFLLLAEQTDSQQELNFSRFGDEIYFEPYFLAVHEEDKSANVDEDHHIQELILNYKTHVEDFNISKTNGSNTQEKGSDAEHYEKSEPMHGDKMFHHYLTTIQNNPGQVLRYNRGGNPLLMSPLEEKPPKQCDHCGGEMVFEFQLLPTLIPTLKLNRADLKNGTYLEFGQVLIYTCRKSCFSDEFPIKSEQIVLQKEVP